MIEPHYEGCGEFSEGLAAVQEDSRWGYIDQEGKVAIHAQFAAADSFSEGLAFVELTSGTKAVIDTSGSVQFEADYYEHGRFREGLAPVHPVRHWQCGYGEEEKEYSGTRPPPECPHAWGKDWNWGYIDRTGRMVIPPQFLLVHEFHEGLALERDGFINHGGNEVIHVEGMATDFSENLAAVEKDDKWGYIDTQGSYIVHPTYEAAEPMSDGRGLVKSDGKCGYIERSGNLIIAAQYDAALLFSEGLAAVRVGGKWGYIDRDGKTSIPFQFDSAQSFQDGQAIVTAGGEVVLIDRSGTQLRAQPPSLAQTFRELQAFEGESDRDGLSESRLPLIAPLMTRYKEQLRQLVARKLAEFQDQSTPAITIKASLEGELERAGIRYSRKKTQGQETEEEEEARPYGLMDELEVFRPIEQPNLLVVSFHLTLATEIDSSLSIYSLADRKLIFRADHNDYDKAEIDAYHIATPQFTNAPDRKSFLMLLASHSGYAANGTYALQVELMRFDQSLQHELVCEKAFYGKAHQVAIEPNGFRLEVLSDERDTYRGGYHVYPYRYRITGPTTVERIAPIAFDAHDFVEEWGNLPWEEAAKWSDPSHLDKLRSWHERYRVDEYFGGEFPQTQSCRRGLWQVEYSEPGEDSDSVFFVVRQLDKWNFVIKEVREDPLPGCSEALAPASSPTMFGKSVISNW